MSDEIQPLNFVRTTLRAPIGASDTQLQLATDTGALFDPIAAGDYVFITVNDLTTAEIMKYTSSGPVVNDTIIVERAQDGTTAKAFPAGSCVAIGWNVQQVVDLINQILLPLVGANTMLVSSTPVGPPAEGIIYAVDPTTGQHWYYDATGPAWVYLNSNSVQLMTVVPTVAPEGNVIWTIDTTTFVLYFWNSVEWIVVGTGGAGSGAFLQVYSRQFLAGTPYVIAKGSNNPIGGPGGMVDLGLSFPAQSLYKSNPAITDKVVLTATDTMQFPAACMVQLSAAVRGTSDDVTKNIRIQLVIFHSDSSFQWQTDIFIPADSVSTDVAGIVTTTPFQVAAGDTWDAIVVCLDGGGTYTGMTMTQLAFSASVIALI